MAVYAGSAVSGVSPASGTGRSAGNAIEQSPW